MKNIFPVLIIVFIISCVSKDKDNQVQEINYVVLPFNESLEEELNANKNIDITIIDKINITEYFYNEILNGNIEWK